jgi:hypothetical protein
MTLASFRMAACELACDRDDRAQHARPLGDPQAPRSQGLRCPDAEQKACGLTKRLPNSNVALLRDTPFEVDGGSGPAAVAQADFLP